MYFDSFSFIRLMNMFEEERDGDQLQQAESEGAVLLQCPHCQKCFMQRRSLSRHINFSCKLRPPDPGPHVAGPRLPPKVKAAEVHYDKELNSLLAAIDSDTAIPTRDDRMAFSSSTSMCQATHNQAQTSGSP